MTQAPQAAREHYLRDGYAALPQFFAREVTEALYSRLVSELDLARPKQSFIAQGPLLTKSAIEVYSHIYPPLAGFLWGLTPGMEAITGCRLLPTYSYFRIYQKDDVCKVHSDRHACEHSLSLTLAVSDDRPWALAVEKRRLDGPTKSVTDDFGPGDFGSVPMMPGDAVVYQGVHHRHGRLDPNPNRWSAHLFLHWIDPDGPYREQAFDRPALDAARGGR